MKISITDILTLDIDETQTISSEKEQVVSQQYQETGTISLEYYDKASSQSWSNGQDIEEQIEKSLQDIKEIWHNSCPTLTIKD